MRFEILNGSHSQSGRLYRKGDVVESSTDLTVQFVNKFQKVTDGRAVSKGVVLNSSQPALSAAEKKAGKEQKPSDAAGDEKEIIEPGAQADKLDTSGSSSDATGSSESGDAAPKGKDVTDQFPEAVEQEFKVYKDKSGYRVYDGDDMSKPINDESIEKKSGVKKAIKAALKS